MNFLESAKEALFWKSRFDSEYESYAFSVSLMAANMIGNGIPKMLEEKRLFFRQNASSATFSSSEAALKAFVDFCDDYQSRTRSDVARFSRAELIEMDLKIDLMHLSQDIAHASYRKNNGDYVFYPGALDSFFVRSDWKDLFDEFCNAKEVAISSRDAIEKFDYSPDKINKALEEISAGVLFSDEGKRVWKVIDHRMTAWEISRSADVSLSESVFWLSVFKRVDAVKSYWLRSPIGPFNERAYLFDLPEPISDALL